MLFPAEHLTKELFQITSRYEVYIRERYQKLLSKIRLRDGISLDLAVEYLILFRMCTIAIIRIKQVQAGDFTQFIEEHDLKISGFLDMILYGISTEEKVR